jgi:CheY-like chemotaxis protein
MPIDIAGLWAPPGWRFCQLEQKDSANRRPIAPVCTMLKDTNEPILLLVEDSEDDVFFFRRTFQKAAVNCAIHHASNGAEAVEFLQAGLNSKPNRLPQSIFLDLKMPVMNGFEVLEWLRRQTFPVPIPVIVLSGSEHQEDKRRAAALGASAYLVKPVKVADLHRLLQDACAANPNAGAPV